MIKVSVWVYNEYMFSSEYDRTDYVAKHIGEKQKS
jgi:hypothetical protein